MIDIAEELEEDVLKGVVDVETPLAHLNFNMYNVNVK